MAAAGDPSVVGLTAQDAVQAGRLGAAAFDDDPLFINLWPRAAHRRRTMESVLRAESTIASEQGGACGIFVDGTLGGIALWARPGTKRTTRQQLLEAVGIRHAILEPGSVVGGIRIFMALEARKPKEPHHYLGVLAVDPAAQGRGVGRGLIEQGLTLSDQEGVPTYLETSKESNLSWYARYGFEVTEEFTPVAGRPPIWTMARRPREAL